MVVARLDLLPGYSYSPDGDSVYLSVGGRIHRISLDDGSSAIVPMRVDVELSIPSRPGPRAEIPGEFTSRMARWPTIDDRCDRVIFESVGQIWERDLSSADENARPITPAGMFAFQPFLSPDGGWIAFVGADGWPVPQKLIQSV